MPILSGNQQKKKFAEKKIRRINYKKLPKQDAHCFSIVLFDIYNAITHNKKNNTTHTTTTNNYTIVEFRRCLSYYMVTFKPRT